MPNEAENLNPRQPAGTDEDFMRQAIRLAFRARERGDTPVGSVVIQDGRIIGEGIEAVKAESDLTAHAEIRAIQDACRRLNTLHLNGCALFTTVEPCVMCSFVIRSARLSRVVIGRLVPHIGGFSSKYPILTDPDISGWSPPPLVITGLLEEECSAPFAAHK